MSDLLISGGMAAALGATALWGWRKSKKQKKGKQ